DMPSSVATISISTLRHTIANFYLFINRFIVLHSSSLSDYGWKRRWIIVMLVVQLLIPILVSFPLTFAQLTG
ncbi:hypothetical protein PENTCL1PPCAC_27126, partial [Pristionchus entomophagus]